MATDSIDRVITDPGPTGGMAPTSRALQNSQSRQLYRTRPSHRKPDPPIRRPLADLQVTGKLGHRHRRAANLTVLLHDPANPGKFRQASIYTAALREHEIAVAGHQR